MHDREVEPHKVGKKRWIRSFEQNYGTIVMRILRGKNRETGIEKIDGVV